MSRNRQIRLIIVGLLVVLAVASLAVYGLTRSDAQIDEDREIYDAAGIRYAAPPQGMTPTVSEAEAIDKALKEAIPMIAVKPETPIVARFMMFSDDTACDVPEDPEDMVSKCAKYLYQDIPAWIITVRDIQFLGVMPGPAIQPNQSEPQYNSVIHVAIDAMTGEIISVYSVR